MDGSKIPTLQWYDYPRKPPWGRKRLMIYMSEEGRHTLASCKHWFVDGTFQSAPEPLFIQVKKLHQFKDNFFMINFVLLKNIV